MLVKFDSEAGSFTMNGDIAVQLLKAMGHSGTVPSAILPRDIPAALARLKAAVDASPKAAAEAPGRDDKDRKEDPYRCASGLSADRPAGARRREGSGSDVEKP